MVNSPLVLTTIPTDTWVEATWEDFLTFAVQGVRSRRGEAFGK
ncbi:MAG: hypothetical protein ACKPEO_11795 [Sphaerospermopsis kisseleviana]|jgi:hypothetical protein|uniref:Uncharacterized protein n=2 Tax=Sphaerospermopsis TaxID=752201 RepID=A0A480A1Z2_9CYAN|nr:MULTISPECIES: hypothetical protein [Sphaerospermopsis]MDB9442820.1 hypothetical protein [Sphaerospermopsis kisseleviana CS-549]BAZ81385.1 hypothetical protein NIES73_26530 [Sphaerospermopsis kisseleviana NIES-73]GCL38857.1 hypothetical protein SR1949_39760 [Sphaerospermopsis reniformis]